MAKMSIYQMQLERIADMVVAAKEVIAEALTMCDAKEGRAGGYFCCADPVTGQPHFVMLIGFAKPEKWMKYIAFS